MYDKLCFACGVCKIMFYRIYKVLCCIPNKKYLPTLNCICVGVDETGKSRMLAALNRESLNTEPTIGFNVKAVKLKNCILNVKELGGNSAVRKYWTRYLTNIESAIITIKLTAQSKTAEELEMQIKALRPVLDVLKLQALNCLFVMTVYEGLQTDSALDMIRESIQWTDWKNCSFVVVHDIVRDLEKIRDQMENFCYRQLL